MAGFDPTSGSEAPCPPGPVLLCHEHLPLEVMILHHQRPTQALRPTQEAALLRPDAVPEPPMRALETLASHHCSRVLFPVMWAKTFLLSQASLTLSQRLPLGRAGYSTSMRYRATERVIFEHWKQT